MHQNDIDRFDLKEGQTVSLTTAVNDGVERLVAGLQIVAYDIPEGCVAGYYPECNPLIPLWHHAKKAKVPAAKVDTGQDPAARHLAHLGLRCRSNRSSPTPPRHRARSGRPHSQRSRTGTNCSTFD